MAIPNLIALLLLSPVVARSLRDFARHDAGSARPGEP
jgi:Na+/alanine symporter